MEGRKEEYCLEFGQVLLKQVTHLGQGPQEDWVPGLLFRSQLLLGMAAPAQGQQDQAMGEG